MCIRDRCISAPKIGSPLGGEHHGKQPTYDRAPGVYRQSAVAVSYTRVDVYKRQVHKCAQNRLSTRRRASWKAADLRQSAWCLSTICGGARSAWWSSCTRPSPTPRSGAGTTANALNWIWAVKSPSPPTNRCNTPSPWACSLASRGTLPPAWSRAGVSRDFCRSGSIAWACRCFCISS